MARSACPLVILAIFAPSLAWAQAGGEPPPPRPAQGAPSSGPPPHYYSEPSGPPPQGPPPQGPPPGGAYEPPPPGYYYGPPPLYEPPPPPKPKHRAPKTAFWLGARGGYFVPAGALWHRWVGPGANDYDEVGWREYASSGPMLELDVGARVSRHYNVFFTWEHASLGTGTADPGPDGEQTSASTDYYALGLRASSNADRVGFLTEINLGWRRFNVEWENGAQLHMYDAPLEFRIGLGADIRVTPFFSLSPMVSLGAGGFRTAEYEAPNGQKSDAMGSRDEVGGHFWFTFQLGGHFDIPGGNGD